MCGGRRDDHRARYAGNLRVVRERLFVRPGGSLPRFESDRSSDRARQRFDPLFTRLGQHRRRYRLRHRGTARHREPIAGHLPALGRLQEGFEKIGHRERGGMNKVWLLAFPYVLCISNPVSAGQVGSSPIQIKVPESVIAEVIKYQTETSSQPVWSGDFILATEIVNVSSETQHF